MKTENNITLKYYNDNADSLSERYDAVDFNKIQKSISTYFIGDKKVIEIGFGSGRDANYLINNGFNVIGIDGSKEMLKKAQQNYPLLNGRLIQAVLPDEFPYFETRFDAAYSIATLMHFDEEGIVEILKKIRNVLKPNSPVYISVSSKRSSDDERFFIEYSKNDWISIFEGSGFIINEIIETKDATNREIMWYSFYLNMV